MKLFHEKMMFNYVLILVYMCTQVQCVDPVPPLPDFDPLIFFGRPKYGTLYDNSNNNKTDANYEYGYFKQKIDHFDDKSDYFKQLYYYRSIEDSSCVFLILGGNGNFSDNSITAKNSPFLEWAEMNRASIFGLEHRYYGTSLPFNKDSLRTENLKYLTIEQTVEDIAYFIETKRKENDIPEHHKWIIFGGSHAGSIALWARQKYPELIFGAVASSAPLQAKIDFYEYGMSIESLFSSDSECYEKVAKTFSQFIDQFKNDRANLAKELNIKYDANQDNVDYTSDQFLFWTLQQPFQIITQYYNVGTRFQDFGLKDICDIFKNADDKTPLFTAIKTAYEKYYKQPITELNTNYASAVATLKSEDMTTVSYDYENRLWLWQLCTQLGYSITTDNGLDTTLFGSTVSTSLFAELCKDVFGLSINDVIAGIEATNSKFGGIAGYTGTNVIFITGTYDPFQYLTKQNGTNKSIRSLYTKGGSHTSDMYPSDDQNIKNTQNAIKTYIRDWFKNKDTPLHASTVAPWDVEFRVKKTFNSNATVLQSHVTHEHIPIAAFDVKPDIKLKLSQVFFGRPPYGFTPSPKWVNDNENSGIRGQITQRLNHEDENSPRFQQFYCQYGEYEKPDGPVYLVIGGESGIDCNWIIDNSSTYVQMAKEAHATLYFLEHRFYGNSRVQGYNNLKYLTMSQAIEDIGSFIEFKKSKHLKKQWILFGSSYAATLAAIARIRFPDIIAGAVGGSAFLNPQFTYLRNTMQMELIIRNLKDSCANGIQKAFTELRNAVMTADVAAKFGTNFNMFEDRKLETIDDRQYFFYILYSAIQGSLFFNEQKLDDAPAFLTMCESLEKGSIEGLSSYMDYSNAIYEADTILSRTSVINVLKDIYDSHEKYDNKDIATANWIWQSCSELVSFPSADSGASIFGTPTYVDFFVRFCKDVFHSNLSNTSSIDFDNTARITSYLIDNYIFNSDDMIFVNGGSDPRLYLNIPKDCSKEIDMTVINKTSHSALFYPASDNDPVELIQIRKAIVSKSKTWTAHLITTTESPDISTTSGNGDDSTTSQIATTTTTDSVSKLTISLSIYLISLFLI